MTYIYFVGVHQFLSCLEHPVKDEQDASETREIQIVHPFGIVEKVEYDARLDRESQSVDFLGDLERISLLHQSLEVLEVDGLLLR